MERGPDEAGELTCDGDDGLAGGLALGEHAVEAAVEAVHRLVGERDDLGGLPVTTALQALGIGLMAVVPGGLDQQAAGMTVAGLGDRTAPLGVGGRELGGDEAEEGIRPRAESKRMMSCSSATSPMAVRVSIPRKQRSAPTASA